MALYATVDELLAYAAGTAELAAELPSDPDELDQLIVSAELDVDRLLDRIDRDPLTGRKLAPAALTAPQRAALSRATCAEALWIAAMDPDDVIGVDPGVASIGGVPLRRAARPPSPRAVEELSGFGFPVRTGTVAPEPDPAE